MGNKEQITRLIKWSLSKRGSRLPMRYAKLLAHIDAISPGLNAVAMRLAIRNKRHLQEGGLVVLSGSVSTGKTAAACCVTLLLVGKTSYNMGGESKVHLSPPDFWFCPAELIVENAYDYTKVPLGMSPTHLTDCPDCLIIDDIGREYLKSESWSSTVVDNFFDARYRNMAPTIITTNLTLPQFRTRYGQRIFERVKEWGIWLNVEGPSLRG